MPSILSKPWSVAIFEKERQHMTNWVRLFLIPIIDEEETNLVLIIAPVKSGKRDIVEYICMRDKCNSSNREHIFISAWHRTADEEQREELKSHNMKVIPIINNKSADQCIKYIKELLEKKKNIILHIDECDHGTGEKQILSKVYKYAREYSNILIILYSATPQEVLFSNDMNDHDDEILNDLLHGIHLQYTPHLDYCGPVRFLNKNLINNATPFFTINPTPSLTDQGKYIIEQLKISTQKIRGKNILILRLTKKNGKTINDKDIYIFLKNLKNFKELNDLKIIVDKSECKNIQNQSNIIIQQILWSNKDYWDMMTKDIPLIIVLDQTSARSTEWVNHDRIFALHDYRDSINYTTVSQAQERVNHYASKYESGFQEIQVYGHKKTFQLSAGLIDYNEYLHNEWKMKKINLKDEYHIKNKDGDIHPYHRIPLNKNDAENILKELDSFNEINLSTRINGNINKLPIFKTKFFECTPVNCLDIINKEKHIMFLDTTKDKNFNNPFEHPKQRIINNKHTGYLREWTVLDYEKDIITQPGWGIQINKPRITICYYKDKLGIALRWHTGEYKEENRLNSYKSMYPSK
jgi:thymidine kinase